MDAGQVDRLLDELGKTRTSFDEAIKQVKWNRINTIVQYVLIAIVIFMLGFGVIYYLNEKKMACVRGNELRVDIQESLDSNAASIGAALVVVAHASNEDFQKYLDVYNQQNKPEVLNLRSC